MACVIWDFNGVIVDDEPVHFRAIREVLHQDGIALDEAEYFDRYLGLDDWGCFTAALDDRGRTTGASEIDALVARKSEIYLAMLDQVRLFPGAADLIAALAKRVPQAIASGARQREIEAVLRQEGLAECFSAVVSADAVERGKPDPEGYLTALDRLREADASVEAARTVVIEDAPHGIAAAKAAGMMCVAVTTSRAREDLGAADHVVERLIDLSPSDLLALAGGAPS